MTPDVVLKLVRTLLPDESSALTDSQIRSNALKISEGLEVSMLELGDADRVSAAEIVIITMQFIALIYQVSDYHQRGKEPRDLLLRDPFLRRMSAEDAGQMVEKLRAEIDENSRT